MRQVYVCAACGRRGYSLSRPKPTDGSRKRTYRCTNRHTCDLAIKQSD